MERNKEETNNDVHPCSDQVLGKGIGAARTHSAQLRGTTTIVYDGPFIGPQSCPPSKKGVEFDSPKGVKIGVQEGSGSNPVILTSRRRYKHTVKRLVKLVTICKFSFVSQCLRLFLKINHQERLVADYALMEDDESSYFT